METACGLEAKRNLLPMQAGDVPITYADIDDLTSDVAFKPESHNNMGMKKFVDWFLKNGIKYDSTP